MSCDSLNESRMTIRQAGASDTEQIWQVIADAKQMMRDLGRNQWTEEYPSLDVIAADIEAGAAYVMCDGDGCVAAYACLTSAPEAAYAAPGACWLTDRPYLVIHRLAVRASYRGRGLARRLLSYAEEVCRGIGLGTIKVDTNHDNTQMLHLLQTVGYVRCGTVSYGPRGERIAFEKPLDRWI